MPRHPEQMRRVAAQGLAESGSTTVALAGYVNLLLEENEKLELENERLREKLTAAGEPERPTKEAAIAQEPIAVSARILRDLHTLALMTMPEHGSKVDAAARPDLYVVTKGVERIHDRLATKAAVKG